ncbi:MAG: SDR family NAD(P)-dependent oxidoreductase [Candidatus Parcubacteria bacterium]|nr:SDR family NAD(P)-dependent oxidoreductase [Candidatus Parcubacteria bacterium]
MKILITGGAGFIGINAADYYLKKGFEVIILDNFSRKGGRENIEWLKNKHNSNVVVVKADVRYEQKKLQNLIENVHIVLHLAGQVAVTSSVENPREDFENNALGTFNMLEAARLSGNNPIFIYSSTNKVYGGLEDLKIIETENRYKFKSLPFGISETRTLDFHSPYGCSKGAAEQYVRDYARIYGLNTIVFRQSCIYGRRQFGIEDQGWIAWFIIALTIGKKITIFGNGKQVRDLLYIDDLLDAYSMGATNIEKTRGQIYNIGGGVRNTISIWLELKPVLEKLFKKEINISTLNTRPGDQPIFISDIRKAKKDFDWEPKIDVEEGIEELYAWIQENKSMFQKLFAS